MKQKTLNRYIQQIGTTCTGKPIFSGGFFMADTVGVPLSILILAAEKQKVVISFPDFISNAYKAKWTQEKIKSYLKETLQILGRFEIIPYILNQV